MFYSQDSSPFCFERCFLPRQEQLSHLEGGKIQPMLYRKSGEVGVSEFVRNEAIAVLLLIRTLARFG